jgi:hypothetical protein
MWNEILDALEAHDNALLTGYDENGFPFSVRCLPMADRQNRRLDVEIPEEAGIQPGRASLLMHSHNEELWDLVQFLIRGTLVRGSEGHYFVPASISGTPTKPGGMDTIRNLRGMRSRANAYIKRRGIARPKVPWEDIQRLQERAEQWRKDRSRNVVQ